MKETTFPAPGVVRRFTLEEANATLVYIGPLVADIQAVYAQIIAKRNEKAEDVCRGCGQHAVPSAKQKRDYNRLVERLEVLWDELHRTGVKMMDFEIGTVHFDMLNRADAFYCWNPEDGAKVVHYHTLETNACSLRRPLG